MSVIYLKTEEEFPINSFSKTGFIGKQKESDSILKIEYEFEILFQSLTEKAEPDFLLIPLNKANIADSDYRILSVSKRMSSFDRLLVPENFSKKNIPSALKELTVVISEDRTMLQLHQVLPDKRAIEKKSLVALSPENDDIRDKAVILPWFADEKPWLNAGYSLFDLHPAEFTPEAGSGCWALLAKGETDDRKKEVVRSLHHPASLVFTNTERKFVRDFDIPEYTVIGTHLESVSEDKYHLYICLLEINTGEINWFDFPSSTFGEMATEAIEAIKIHLKQQTLI